MIEYFKRVDKKEKLKKINSITEDCWIKCVNPKEEDLSSLAKKFKLRTDLLIDGLDVYENPRIEQEKGNIYIFLRAPISENTIYPKIEQESSESFLLVLTKDNVITVSKTDLEIFRILENSKSLLTNDRSLTTLLILSYISRTFGNSVREIMKTVKKDKTNISHYNEKDLFKLVIKEDAINDYLSSFSPLIDINKQVVSIKALRFPEEEKEFIEDLAIDLNQTLNTCKSALKNISNMRDYYTATLTNKLNKTITILTFFTVFLTIPTIIFSLYGMNIALPLQQHPLVFELIISGIVLGWVGLIIILKKLKMF
jgi:magnesium transporter